MTIKPSAACAALFPILLLLAAAPAPAAVGSVYAPDGNRIDFTVEGAGAPTVVFVHCWSCDRTYWDAQVPYFAADHRVVTIDLAGHGTSDDARDTYTMAAYGQDVAAVLAKLQITDAVLVGHSMGGCVIVEAALAAPERVVGLVGVDNFQDVDMKLSPEMVDSFVGQLTTGDYTANVAGFVKQMFPADADPALVEAITADMAAGSAAVGVSSMHELLLWYGGQAPERLARLKAPLMCINADLRPTKAEAITALVPGYQLRIMPGRGHFLMREDPDLFNALLAATIVELTP